MGPPSFSGRVTHRQRYEIPRSTSAENWGKLDALGVSMQTGCVTMKRRNAPQCAALVLAVCALPLAHVWAAPARPLEAPTTEMTIDLVSAFQSLFSAPARAAQGFVLRASELLPMRPDAQSGSVSFALARETGPPPIWETHAVGLLLGLSTFEASGSPLIGLADRTSFDASARPRPPVSAP